MRGWLGLGMIVVSLGLLEITQIPYVSVAAAQPDYAPDAVRGSGRDQTGRPTEVLVVQRLRSLSGLPRAEELAGDSLSHARRALRRARDLVRGGRQDAAERARQIAWAALSLASRQIARAQETEVLARARRELAQAEARAARAREALEHAMRQQREAQEREASSATAASSTEPSAEGTDE